MPDDIDIEWLATHGNGLLAPRGKTQVREGQTLDSVFVRLDGELAVTTGSKQIATLYAGEVVGEISFVDSLPPLATAKDRLERKMDTDKKFAANFYHAIAIFLADRLRFDDGAVGIRRGQGAAGGSAGGG